MLTEKNETYYKAYERRDPKFDGRVYFGVKTTGIYCRPICPARPHRQNVSFYSTQAAAEAAGYRPCKRCRPDLSPLSPQWQGSAAVIGRALEAIKKAEVPLSEVAERMGMTDRHLRRLFSEHVGASPVQIRQSYRLHLAQQLLAQTSMKMVDVAMASGFGSVRRFNDAFAKTYKRSPADIRKEKKSQVSSAKAELTIEIPLVGYFDFQSVLHFFRRHLVEGVEFVGDDFYERHFERGVGSTGWFRVSFNEKRSCVQLQIDSSDTAHVRFVIERVKALFDLQHNPAHIQVKSVRHKGLGLELQKIRIPGAFNTFETAVCIILGQLVSTDRARQLVKSLVSTYGPKLKNTRNENLQFLFPSPKVLATAPLEELGLTRQRAQAIRDFAAVVRD
ncbi:MAG: helix-turn-helix domain-containing protein, partial [Bdellovibrionaceae bacterium]|nr:helix-turn-helix domain-containing protein [Pseudobdellovibrionaceae bacterium]